MRLLDRYVLRNFLEPFLLCFFGFIAIWLLLDLYNNSSDFIQYHTPMKMIARYYLSQLPAVVLLSIPIGLLLAILFSLSKMSRHNEIISMITAGCSVVRVLAPLIVVGALASVVSYFLNREWAPHAEGVKKIMLEAITRGEQRAEGRLTMDGYLFRNRKENRTWFVQHLRLNSADLVGVHISQQDEAGNIRHKWYALRASYQAAKHQWTLLKGMQVDLDEKGDVVKIDSFPEGFRIIPGWDETPWRIASGQLEAQNLSIDELRDYLKGNSDFPAVQLASFRTNLADRFAFPLSCLVVIFIAAPLGIVFSRRGVLSGVATSIFIFFAMILLRYLFLWMGKGNHIDPEAAAWLPDVLFMGAGMFLLYLRASNRELKLAFWK